MQLTINGQPAQIEDVPTLAALIEKLGLKSQRVAVEVNRQVVSWKKHAQTPVKDGDVIEIVSFVGGG